MKIRNNTKRLINAGIIGASIVFVIAGIIQYLFYQSYQKSEDELSKRHKSEIGKLIDSTLQNQEAYSLISDVEANQEITRDMLKEVYVPTGASPEDSFSIGELRINDNKYYAKTDMKSNTLLSKSMLYKDTKISKSTREAEYSFINLPLNLNEEDSVDIRIQFPSGDDFILLPKKKIKDISGLTVWINVEEEEILRMSSAVVDAYIEGAKIYAISYVDKNMQDAPIPTYPVKKNVNDIIKKSPNIVGLAESVLIDRNRETLEESLKTMDPSDADKVRAEEYSTKQKVESDNRRLTEEERINELNKANQSDIISPERK